MGGQPPCLQGQPLTRLGSTEILVQGLRMTSWGWEGGIKPSLHQGDSCGVIFSEKKAIYNLL